MTAIRYLYLLPHCYATDLVCHTVTLILVIMIIICLQYGEIYNFPQAVFEKALDDEEIEEDTEARDEESTSELEEEHEV